MGLKETIAAAAADKRKADEIAYEEAKISHQKSLEARAAANDRAIHSILTDETIGKLVKFHIENGKGSVAYYVVSKGEAVLSTPEGNGNFGPRMRKTHHSLPLEEAQNLSSMEGRSAFQRAHIRVSELRKEGVEVDVGHTDDQNALIKIDYSKARSAS